MKKPNISKLRPDLPPPPEKPLPGERHEFRDLTPPIKEVLMSGPEQTYQISIVKQVRAILESYGVFKDSHGIDFWDESDKQELIDALLKWRRA